MRPLAKTANPLARACTWALHSYLIVFVVGCAAHRPPMADAPVAETHLVQGDEPRAFRSCVAALEEAGYTVDVADPNEGVIHGTLLTNEPIGVIADENGPDLKPMPGWQVGVLVLTGAAMLVGGALSLTQALRDYDPGDEAEERIGAALGMLKVASSIEVPLPITYEYQIAIQLLPMEGNTTQVRVLIDGKAKQGKETPRNGPVLAPEFLTRFYAALDQSMSAEPEDQTQQALSTR